MSDYLGKFLLGPNDENQGIYTGDARLLSKAIPDESVDLIFTDPVYQNIEDYRWLAETAARVLKPDSTLLVWTHTKWLKEHILALEPLLYRLKFDCICGSGPGPLVGKCIARAQTCLWMDKSGTSKLLDYLVDGMWTRWWGHDIKSWYNWTKNPYWSQKAALAFTNLDGVVVDFFTGGGTVPAICKMLGRKWLAFEIEPGVAELARKRVAQTQPPLFALEPEQMELMSEYPKCGHE